MALGISSYTYTWTIGVPDYPVPAPVDALGLLRKTADFDLSLLQIADNLPLDALDQTELRKLAQSANTLGVQIEVGTRGIRPAHLMAYLEIAQSFASPILRVVIDTPDHHPTIPQVIDLLRESLSAFERAGITLAVENHDRFSVQDFTYIMETFDSPHLGICLDTVNSFGALEGPRGVIEALAPWTVNLHIKDFTIRRAGHMMGFVIEGTPAGQGRLDLPRLLEELHSRGRSFNAILELWTPPEPQIAATIQKEDRWAAQSLAYLRQFNL